MSSITGDLLVHEYCSDQWRNFLLLQSLRHASAPSVMIAIRSVLTQACVFIYLSTKLFSATSKIFEWLFNEGTVVVECCCPKAFSRPKLKKKKHCFISWKSCHCFFFFFFFFCFCSRCRYCVKASSRPINIASITDSVVLTQQCSHYTLVCRAGMKREAEEAMHCPRTTKRFCPFQKRPLWLNVWKRLQAE